MRIPRSERLVALDAFRGLTIAGMLLVNNPGTWSAIYPPLRHAEWPGFASWLAPRNASLAFAVTFVLVWYLILLAFERRRIVFRV